jgi:hypothetical protein
VGIPLHLLPSYAAVAFLPSSLKPLYAYISSCSSSSSNSNSNIHGLKQPPQPPWRHRRDTQISILLTCSAFSYAATAFIPKHAFVTAFIMAFCRGMFDAWPEFLLGLNLMDHALWLQIVEDGPQQQQQQQQYKEVVTRFQSQAATARNLGSLMAHILGGCLLVGIRITRIDNNNNNNVLNDTTVAILLYLTAAFNLIGSIIIIMASRKKCEGVELLQSIVENSASSCSLPLLDPTCEDGNHLRDPLIPTTTASAAAEAATSLVEASSSCRNIEQSTTVTTDTKEDTQKIVLVITLQILVILVTLQKPIEHVTSMPIWIGLSTITVAVLLQMVYSVMFASKAQRLGKVQCRIGLFLILRNSLPSVTYIMSSYLFTIFETSPLVLQFLFLFDVGISSMASWLYGKLFCTFSNRRSQLIRLIAGTTIFAATASLGNLILFRMLQRRPNSSDQSPLQMIFKFAIAVAVRCVMGVADQWNFLPDLVLATTSIEPITQSECVSPSTSDDHFVSELEANNEENGHGVLVLPDDFVPMNMHHHPKQTEFASSPTRVTTRASLVYGTFISCIDLGGQLGALTFGPILNWIGTSRDNQWNHLDWILELNSLCILFSLIFLLLLR